MHSGCVQNVLFTNDELAIRRLSSVKLFKNFKEVSVWKQLCELHAKTIIHHIVVE